MRPSSCLALLSLLLVGACTRVPAESTAPAPAVPAAPAPAAAPPQAAAAPSPSQPAVPPPGEPAAPPAASPAAPQAPAAVPLAGVRSTAIASGHITLTGSYKVDSEAEVTCAPFPEGALQLTLMAPGKPRVILRLDELAGRGTSGTYKGQVAVVVSDPGEAGMRQSTGTARSEVTVEAPTATASPASPRSVSGSFSTTYTGEAGKGTVAGRFDRCEWKEPAPTDRP